METYEHQKKEQSWQGQTEWKEEPQSCYDTKRTPLGLKYYIFAILSLAMFYVVMFGRTAEDEYLEHGIETQAVVTGIETTRPAGKQRKIYYCAYVDAEGISRNAELIPNTSVYTGERVQGYYLPEDPGTVWCEPTAGLTLVLRIFACVFGLIGALLLILPLILRIRDRIGRKS